MERVLSLQAVITFNSEAAVNDHSWFIISHVNVKSDVRMD